jgi:trimethylamine-N-oxide reductase (cytochrome c)
MESIIPGTVYVDHGARCDPIIPGELDRGGAINTIMPHRVISKNCTGMVVSGFPVEVEGTNLDELRKKYPEAFKRPCDRASGLRMERVMYGGDADHVKIK